MPLLSPLLFRLEFQFLAVTKYRGHCITGLFLTICKYCSVKVRNKNIKLCQMNQRDREVGLSDHQSNRLFFWSCIKRNWAYNNFSFIQMS